MVTMDTMLMGLETSETNTGTVGVLQQWSPELSEGYIVFIVSFLCLRVSLGHCPEETVGPLQEA